jgi:hypothetical protein
MRRAAANAAATADALLAWLGTQARSGAAAAPSESDGHPEGAVSAQDRPVAMASRMRSPTMCR